MKALTIALLAMMTAACGQMPPELALSPALSSGSGWVLAAFGDCSRLRTSAGVTECRAALPEQVVGEENHAAVLDGRS